MQNKSLTTLTIDLTAPNNRLRLDLENANRYTGNWARRTRDHVTSTADMSVRQFDSIGNAAKTAAKGVAGIFAAAAANVGLSESLSQYADFETALVGVGKTTNISGQTLLKFGEQIESMSLRLPVASTELLEIAESAGQLGVTGTKNLTAFVDTIARLGASSDLGGSDAVTTLARILNITGDGVGSVAEFGSVIVALGNQFAATESEIATMTNEVARSTAVFNVNAAQAAAVSAALRSMGIQSELGGSSVGRAFRAIDTSIRIGGESLKDLSDITGIAADKLKTAFADNSTAVFQSFVEGLGRAMQSGKSAAAVLERFGLKGEEVQKVLPVLAKNADVLSRAMSVAGKETQSASALIAESEKAFDTLSSDLVRAENAAKSLAKSFASQLAPSVSRAAQEFTGFVGDSSGARELTDGFVTAIGALAIVTGSRLTRGLQSSALASAQYYKQLAVGNVVTLDSVRAGKQKAELSARLAANDLIKANAAVVSAKSELQSVQSTHAQIVAERQLETARLKSQITEKGRRLSIARLVEQRRAEQAIVKSVAAAEVNLATAKTAAAAASTKAAVATTAYTTAQQNALIKTRLLNTASTALKSTMSLLGGPLGVVALAGYALYEYSQNAKRAEISSEELTNKLRELQGQGQQVQLEKQMQRYADAVKDAQKELLKLESRRIEFESSIAKQNRPALATELSVLKDLDNSISQKETRISELTNVVDAFKLKLNELDDPNPNRKKEQDPVVLGSSSVDLDDEYKKINSSLQRQIELFGSVGEAVRVRYEIERGELKGLSDAKQSALLKAAQELDNLKTADRAGRELESVQSQLETEEQALANSFLRRREIVDNAHAAGLISEQKQNALLLENRRQYIAAEQQLSAKNKITTLQNYGQLFDGLAGIAESAKGRQSGVYRALFAASKAFSIAEAVVKIQAGIANAAANPYPKNIAAMASVVSATSGILTTIRNTKMQSFDGGGFTGTGPRSGGIDGRGGFAAIVHPNETIIDHTKGQRMSTNVTVNVIENSERAGEVSANDDTIEIYVDRVRAAMIDDINRGRGVGSAIKTKFNLTSRAVT